MQRLLPFVFLISVASTFGISWIVVAVDPDSAGWYNFALLIFLIFATVAGFLGLFLFFVRTRFYKRYSVNWYIKTSFKMSVFVAFFVALASTLAILQLISIFNLILAGLAVSLFAIWSFLGGE
ncbi:hypothetical protein A3A54_01960 [Candidatus Curtissbacteria bacterium RIFCSPLOWO2_01_FULL_39_62]|uniref:Uncharacterized protein n=2 Tax=Candidatus Curtissiibacteriota TaxID=1752717 RepID=A0A1F5GA67_9BACT|nr:MAG: hypothetical protein A2775_00765 [Candidatus Curtissbacteria bacterium RIFCSPHIGHO2_01_FULL_39_57]OGD88771.1 MAG: hypothetical protein A3D04_04405 [Candidatus Curtissbacteria bacterium RIFCSPHIGHO2_02_FULL_40_16b]OGD90531.1 MAG: hypothetical protein A3E11_02655 [Candidatus Curtissbacteria bacterium RIFCSPHIGHO2_12_FULL_38_37]OGD99209.1 MAG: hypothetical protein A3J17_01105 [Candidatus Curtissbacteria bacterium RIFCSPLOWO2_02_FULL_40_11]OGE00960.1 MAG: hypothetical protein A3A54_01960 [C